MIEIAATANNNKQNKRATKKYHTSTLQKNTN